jgi:hypothetical protein
MVTVTFLPPSCIDFSSGQGGKVRQRNNFDGFGGYAAFKHRTHKVGTASRKFDKDILGAVGCRKHNAIGA